MAVPYPNQVPDEPLAEVGREPLHQAIAGARDERRGGISVQTLGVAAAASAAASYAASHLWGPGTVASAALTPVVVALVSEFLHRPINKVSATAARAAPLPPRPPGSRAVPGREAPPLTPDPADWTPISYGPPAPQPRWRPRWRLVLLTGLTAFAIVVGVYTVPDLVLGHSITGSGGATTFFSSGSSTPTVQVPVQTVTPAPPAAAESAPTTSTDTTPLAPQAAPQPTTPTTGTAPSTTDTTPSTTSDTTPTGATAVPTTP